MQELVLQYEIHIRLSAFFGVLFIIGLWEIRFPRKKLTASKTVRWFGNLGITFINGLALRVSLPIMAVGMAVYCRENSWGLLNVFKVNDGLAIVIAVMLMDFIIYFQHVLFHSVPTLWRLHRMHHTDLDLDVSSGSRFHPIEICLSMLIKLSAIAVIGPLPAAVVVFEVFLNVTAMFNHGNIFIPLGLDRIIRWILVTPDMHRVHHSLIRKETNSNYGFGLSWWDRIMGTYTQAPEAGHSNMTIGIEIFRDPKFLKLHWLLIQPFLKPKA